MKMHPLVVQDCIIESPAGQLFASIGVFWQAWLSVVNGVLNLPLAVPDWQLGYRAATLPRTPRRNDALPWAAALCNNSDLEHAVGSEMDVAETAQPGDSTATDWADIQGTLGGDSSSYARLVKRYQAAISAYMWRFTRDPLVWDELVQDVFVEGYLSLPKYARRAPLLHWLKRIATRVGYRYWRARRRRQDELPLPDESELSRLRDGDGMAVADAADLVQYLLAQLAPRDRLVMTLTYMEGCDVKEIVQLTGWTRTMVKVQAHRARRRLARICAERGIEL